MKDINKDDLNRIDSELKSDIPYIYAPDDYLGEFEELAAVAMRDKTADVGNRIKELRKERGLTQSELAKCIGVNKSAISRYEQGVAYPSLQRVRALAAALHTTEADIVNYNPERSRLENMNYRKTIVESLILDNSFPITTYPRERKHNVVTHDLYVKYGEGNVELSDIEVEDLYVRTSEYFGFILQKMLNEKTNNEK